MNKSILFIIILSFYECADKYSISPDILDQEHIGKSYYQVLNISCGRVIPYTFHISSDFEEDMGVVIELINKDVAGA